MNKLKALLVSLIVLATIFVNYLSNALPINGQNTVVISDRYFTFFTPAGFTFAIWGVIYVGLITYAIYHWLNLKNKKQEWLEKAVPWFVLANVANMLWLITWHYEQLGLSVLVMLVILGSLIKTYLLVNDKKVPNTQAIKLMVQTPISIYLGWISVATIANIASTLTQAKFSGFGIDPQLWSVALIAVATLLGITMLARRGDVAYVAVLIWATYGISRNFVEKSPLVSMTATAAAVLLGVMVLALSLRKRVK